MSKPKINTKIDNLFKVDADESIIKVTFTNRNIDGGCLNAESFRKLAELTEECDKSNSKIKSISLIFDNCSSLKELPLDRHYSFPADNNLQYLYKYISSITVAGKSSLLILPQPRYLKHLEELKLPARKFILFNHFNEIPKRLVDNEKYGINYAETKYRKNFEVETYRDEVKALIQSAPTTEIAAQHSEYKRRESENNLSDANIMKAAEDTIEEAFKYAKSPLQLEDDDMFEKELSDGDMTEEDLKYDEIPLEYDDEDYLNMKQESLRQYDRASEAAATDNALDKESGVIRKKRILPTPPAKKNPSNAIKASEASTVKNANTEKYSDGLEIL